MLQGVQAVEVVLAESGEGVVAGLGPAQAAFVGEQLGGLIDAFAVVLVSGPLDHLDAQDGEVFGFGARAAQQVRGERAGLDVELDEASHSSVSPLRVSW